MTRRRRAAPLMGIVAAAAALLVAGRVSGWSPQLGLDLQGGVSVVLEPTKDVESDTLDQAISVIRDRVDAIGVAEPEIARQGKAIVVQLPGVDNQRRALDLVGDTAELRFRPVLSVLPGSLEDVTSTTGPPDESTTTAAGSGSTTTSVAPVEGNAVGGATLFDQDVSGSTTTAPSTTAAPAGTTPAGTSPAPTVTPRADDVADQPVLLTETRGDEVVATFQLGPTLATGSIVQTARAELNQSTGQWFVALTVRGGDGIDRFNQAAATCYGRADACPTGQLAIVLDSNVVSAPQIQTPSFERDQIQISGDFSKGEAKDLALVLRYGSLPIELEPQTVQTVSATLGEDSLNAGLAAGFLGLGLVCLYMLVYYRALGLVVLAGLAVWAALNFSIISWLGDSQGLALSLSGVTGIVVSIGVTVDSYVVYFERLKDEVRQGRSLNSSVDRAFRRAFRTIVAADVSSFIGAALLYWLTIGPVRGFAFFLGLSTLLDVVVAWFFTRPAVALLAKNRFFTDAPRFGVARGLAGAPSAARVGTAGGAT